MPERTQTTGRRRWEYHTQLWPSFYDSERLVPQLNDLGQDGWELVAVDAGKFVFKREVSDA